MTLKLFRRGVLFDFYAVVDNAEDWQLGMLRLGLTAFENAELTIGGGSSRGLGVIKLSLSTATYVDSSSIIKYLTGGYKGENADWQLWTGTFQDKIKTLQERN